MGNAEVGKVSRRGCIWVMQRWARLVGGVVEGYKWVVYGKFDLFTWVTPTEIKT